MNQKDGLGTGAQADATRSLPHGSFDMKLGPGAEFDLIEKSQNAWGRWLGDSVAIAQYSTSRSGNAWWSAQTRPSKGCIFVRRG